MMRDLDLHDSDNPRLLSRDAMQESTSAAVRELLRAFKYARDTRRSEWDFAVDLATLRGHGATDNDLRWLLCKGYAKHAREVTKEGDAARRFEDAGELFLTERSCFVLTKAGLQFAQGRTGDGKSVREVDEVLRVADPWTNRGNHEPKRPYWDAERRELMVARVVVKRYRRPAVNQEVVLAVFEEEGWPERIDDPLPPTTPARHHQVPKQEPDQRRAPLQRRRHRRGHPLGVRRRRSKPPTGRLNASVATGAGAS